MKLKTQICFNKISKQFYFNIITPLNLAVYKDNLNIVKLLLTNEKVDINIAYKILLLIFFMIFLILIFFNTIQNPLFQYNSKILFSIMLKIHHFNGIQNHVL